MGTTWTSTEREWDVRSGDAALFVRAIGGRDGGPALVAIHGGPGLSHDYLRPLEALAIARLRVVTYDQRGVGRSTGALAGGDPLRQYADDLEALRGALGVERLHLLAHPGGGLTAIAYASIHPERAASLIFVDSIAPTAAGFHAGLARAGVRLTALQEAGRIPQELPVGTPEDGTAPFLAILPAYFADPAHPGTRNLGGSTLEPRVFGAVIAALGDYDLRPALAALTMPTLSFVSDVPFGAAMASELAAALPAGRARQIRLRECGHSPWIECPDPFLAEARAFLEPLIEHPTP